jgi:hypothetical protein
MATRSKRARESQATESLLRDSDRIAEQQLTAPNASERAALSSYCTLSLQVKKREAAAQEHVEGLKPRVKDLRSALLAALKEEGEEVFTLPLALRRDADTRAAARGLPLVPPYVRVVRSSKDVAISAEVISQVLSQLSDDDVLEAEGADGLACLVSAVLAAVRRQVRSFTEQVKLVESAPRGTRPADIPQAPLEMSRLALAMHEAGSLVLQAEREKREDVARVKHELDALTGAVEAYFARGNMTHQRVKLEGAPYNLCRRVTVQKPRLTFKALELVLADGLSECLQLRGVLDKQQLVAALRSRREEVQRAVASRIATLPTTTKTLIHLQRVKARKSTPH